MQSHPALRPPHLFHIPPHVYAVSSERISNARGGDDPNDANSGPLDTTFQQYLVTDSMLDSSDLTPEQAMEVDAARALEELAVAGRVEGWHGIENGSGDTEDQHESDGASGDAVAPNRSAPVSHSQTVSATTPLSSSGSMDQTGNASDGTGSGESSAEDKARASALGDESRRPTNNDYYRDSISRAAIPPPIVKSRKRTSGLPVPVPHLTKPSRGRRVPTAIVNEMEVDSPEADGGPPSPPTSRSGTSSPYGTRRGAPKPPRATTSPTSMTSSFPKPGDNPRSYVCKVEGCGKAFKRGEHLKRHVRSLHTHEKRMRIRDLFIRVDTDLRIPYSRTMHIPRMWEGVQSQG